MSESKVFEQTLALLNRQKKYSEDEVQHLRKHRASLYESLGRTTADIESHEAVVTDLAKAIETLEQFGLQKTQQS